MPKLTYIIMLGWYLRYGDHYRRMRGLIVPFVLAFVPMGLILYEPDLGTALLYQGDLSRARSLYEQALELNRKLGNQHWQATNLGRLGEVARPGRR